MQPFSNTSSSVATTENETVQTATTATQVDNSTSPETTLPEGQFEAMFGAGCFWGVEETFRAVPGVITTSVGYSGGKTKNPTYKEVCQDETGHAEVVHVTYDPSKVSYSKLLEVFFENHNPMQLNRQGPDVGTQYRSAVFFYNDEQRAAAEATIAKLGTSGKFPRPIVTEVTKAQPFFKAEEYHQRYLAKRGLSNCHM